MRDAKVLDLTLSLDTSAYGDGDLLAETQLLSAEAFHEEGAKAFLESLVVIDQDDLKLAFDIVFLQSNVSLGTENATPSISDTDALKILGTVTIGTADYKDLGGVAVATLRDLRLLLEAASGSRSLYVGAISRGTGTYTAAGLKLRIGIEQVR